MSKTIALIGNQNCGKTTLFNCITGSNQYVGNWPGVTLDKVAGFVSSQNLKVVDLPGLYSLSPYSPEEIVSRNFLIDGDYDVIVNLVDATHLERSLSLTCEVMTFKRPMVIALNMMDKAEKSSIKIDTAAMSKRFGVPVVAISAANSFGIDKLFEAIENATVPSAMIYDEALEQSIASVASELKNESNEGNSRFAAMSLLQNDKAFMQQYKNNEAELGIINREILNLEKKYSTDVESLIAQERYSFIDSVIAQCVVKGKGIYNDISRKIDNVVTHRYLGIPIFIGVVWMVYYLAVSTIGTMGTDYANDVLFGTYATEAATSLMESISAPEWLSGLVVDGIIGGVGAVLGFVPQMIVLFALLSILEQSGYMTRVAFVLDRVFRHFGLSGRCFIPMVVASGCGVPAIMATNNIDNINEKRITIITTTFVPCSAKLPILAMIAAAFFPESTFVAPAVYFLAIFSIGFTAYILKKDTAFKEEVSPFVLEMPNYNMPKLRNVFRSTYERCRAFVIKAGTVIFATVVVIWFLSNFNFTSEGFGMVEVNDSILAAIGSAIAFIFIPLGFASWQASVSVITGLLAKENVVGTLAVLLGLGEVAEDDASLGAALNAEFSTSAAAMAFLAFNLFSTPCIAALGAMRRQLKSPRLFTFAVVYMLAFAYGLAMVIYQLGGFITGQVGFGPGTVVAGVIVLLALYLVFRPERKARTSIQIPVKQI
ncbi:MAG: ferrous iron transport protein B [Anaerobiospirillum succiniciproducens]|uniref:ferrous iron transport protein B n=1 Tax=Anaerobiospirillum succiniciproducens TaxID=13335 RepID=UPI002357677D|nr:ferrous iron transport protein B [Anaerobiospirillum succiniciproducens]MCI6863386.1 ferrous iron transport protein B [Anaerobiospirillum succiniciproducens]MDY2798794.1 ferrous iron transport protein B [Anaerobiospirillum succiniciproducens]